MLHGNMIIAFAAVVLCLASQLQAGYVPRFQSCHLLVFTGTLSEYSLHRLLKYYSLGRADRKAGYMWMFSNQLLAWLFFLFTLTAFAVSFFYVDALVKWIIMVSGAIALLYSLPVIGPAGFLSLRKIPFVKTFLVALVWSVVTVIVPLTGNSGVIPVEKVSWIFIERFLLIFPLALLFDIRDADVDRESGIRTIPVVFGEKLTRKLAVCIVLLFIFIYPLAAGTFVFHSHFMPAIFWSLPVLWFTYRKSDAVSPLYYSMLLDGSLVLYGCSVIAGGYFFNHLLIFQ
ncbi:MAG: UbiA family prenyltransferase [Bacteroidota bacterium]